MTNLARYVPWQFRDFVRERGIALLLVGFLLGFTVVGPVRLMGGAPDDVTARRVLNALLVQVPFICAFIALNGIVSTDRKSGYFRFLFAKPVSIPAYYAQLFAVYFVGFLAVCAVFLALFGVFLRPVPVSGPLLFCALVFLSFGGIAFLVSTLFRHDWPILAAIFLGSTVLYSLWRFEEGWKRLVLAVLPPIYNLPGMASEITGGTTPEVNDLLHLLGYSLACFIAGLVILRRRPFD